MNQQEAAGKLEVPQPIGIRFPNSLRTGPIWDLNIIECSLVAKRVRTENVRDALRSQVVH